MKIVAILLLLTVVGVFCGGPNVSPSSTAAPPSRSSSSVQSSPSNSYDPCPPLRTKILSLDAQIKSITAAIAQSLQQQASIAANIARLERQIAAISPPMNNQEQQIRANLQISLNSEKAKLANAKGNQNAQETTKAALEKQRKETKETYDKLGCPPL